MTPETETPSLPEGEDFLWATPLPEVASLGGKMEGGAGRGGAGRGGAGRGGFQVIGKLSGGESERSHFSLEMHKGVQHGEGVGGYSLEYGSVQGPRFPPGKALTSRL